MKERRFYTLTGGMTGSTSSILRTYDGRPPTFGSDTRKPDLIAEIPPVFWGIPLSAVDDYFRNGNRPRIRWPSNIHGINLSDGCHMESPSLKGGECCQGAPAFSTIIPTRE